MRVIAGNYKGLPLKSLPNNHTRPTGDKVKESLFQMLGPFFPGGLMLDLYGGSGSIAIEAISRGMKHAVIVENYPSAQKIIEENIKKTGSADNFTLLKMDAKMAIYQLDDIFDLIFLDPPYAQQDILADMAALATHHLVGKGRLVVCETVQSVELPNVIHSFKKITKKNYGVTALHFYRNEEKE
ncbi:16S rRNA (guanine(966)-N(2))-methyltransferase RsmD [Allofustis seminis]|uniref:16S rRNA (guanine(966)-N(2))-methyltransferase RsmD n=1 Tax=Allofustis seminis TaxID=166939 RepID=UPI00037C3D01|nr:16S rRNA (guanine(966)-N(2))-methyltransferase RsmD [Allofustis seminis]